MLRSVPFQIWLMKTKPLCKSDYWSCCNWLNWMLVMTGAVSSNRCRSRTKFLFLSFLSCAPVVGFLMSTQFSYTLPLLLLRFLARRQWKRLQPSCYKAFLIVSRTTLGLTVGKTALYWLKSNRNCPIPTVPHYLRSAWDKCTELFRNCA